MGEGVEDKVLAARLGTDTPDNNKNLDDLQQGMGQYHAVTSGEKISDDV